MKSDHPADEGEGDGTKVRDKGAEWEDKEEFDDD